MKEETAQEVAQYIREITTMPKDELIKRNIIAHEYVIKEFSWTRHAENIEKHLYVNLIKEYINCIIIKQFIFK